MSNINARDLSVLADFLPDLADKSVLQLGCAQEITQVFANKNVKSITVVDSNPDKLKANQETLSTVPNVVFAAKKLGEIESLNTEFDLIYSDSNFVHFSDELILMAVEKSLRILKTGGLLVLREAFGNANITKLGLTPTKFIDLIQSKIIEHEETKFLYDLVFAKPNKSLTLLHQVDKNNNEIEKMSFVLTKTKVDNYNGFKTLKEFLDNAQYTRNGVLRYEKIFDSGFISAGGLTSTTAFFKELEEKNALKPGQKVLDVGCGIGGGDFLMAKQFGVDVLGMDLSANVIGIAWERAKDHLDLNVEFEIGDIKKQLYPNSTFDFIYSRDTLLYIDDKEALFAKFKDWLKPGGKIFISDYCCGPKPWSDNYAAYVVQRGYQLKTVEEYGQVFTDLGFCNVEATNVTDFMVEMLNSEIKRMEGMKTEFIEEFSQKDYDELMSGWEDKLVRCAAGNQVWGKFYCEKAE